MSSIWEESSGQKSFDRQKKDIKTDVLIIGGGITGILCAYMLDCAGVDYTLVEADKICGSVTKNTTAKITFQHGLIYDKLIRKFGIEKARMYLCANMAALEKFRELCRKIECGFEEKDAYVYSLDNPKKIEKELKALESLGYHAEFSRAASLPFPVAGAVRFLNQAQFNPLQFIYGICENLNIFENTEVRELVGNTAITNHGKIKAGKIIVTTHFPFLNKHGSYFLKMYQHRSYVIALENAKDMNGMYVDEKKTGMSFRNYGQYLLIGGGGHRTGKKGGGWREIEDFANRYFPKAPQKCRWATQDCMSLDGVPYIGRYSANTPELFVATGFNKWGMTSSMAAAMILCDMIQEKDNLYAPVFSPSRSILRFQLAVNGFEAVGNLLTPSSKRCPHLGCALKWNPQERSWDCPCHGSRFTEHGKLLDNPATGDLKRKK